ncbi:MAG: hypothetical protein O2794_03375 [bacterium]|nr:hypothetical protein [bacterium]
MLMEFYDTIIHEILHILYPKWKHRRLIREGRGVVETTTFGDAVRDVLNILAYVIQKQQNEQKKTSMPTA